MKISTKDTVLMGLLIGLSIVLTRFASFYVTFFSFKALRVGIGGFPIMLAGIILGPFLGGIVGIVADVVGFFIWNSSGMPFMPHFTFISMVMGVLPGIFYNMRKRETFSFIRLVLAVIVTQFVTSIVLTPIALNMAFNISWNVLKVSLVPRFLLFLIKVPVYSYTIHLLFKGAGQFIFSKSTSR